jgi:anti-anti-sigma regulatory factor
MATSEENDLIGYDPLAWMEDSTDKNEDNLVTDEIVNTNSQDDQGLIDNEISADDYSDNLIEESEILSATEEDDLIVDEIEVESDSALIEEAADEGMNTEDMETQEVAVDDAMSVEEYGSLVDLDATLTIQNVVKLHEKLKNVLALHDEIEINASDVSSIDTATLQLLVSLKKDAVKLQKKVDIIYPSPRFVESAKLLGLLDVLEVHDA